MNYVDPTGHFFEELFGLAGSLFGEKGRKTGSDWGKKLDDALGLNGGSTAPTEKKKTGNSVVDSNQRSAKNRGKAYATREDAVYYMNEMLKAAAAEADYKREFGAFVYEFEGEFYISSIIQGEIDSVTN